PWPRSRRWPATSATSWPTGDPDRFPPPGPAAGRAGFGRAGALRPGARRGACSGVEGPAALRRADLGRAGLDVARDYYGILGVDKDATDQDLKRAYRKLARELHPDVNPAEEAQQRFAEVSTAYEVLTDPEKRRIVDLGGDPLDPGGGGMGGGFPGGFGGGGLGDVFEAFFGGGMSGGGGGRGPRSRVQPGSDALLGMSLTLEECATGLTKQITV